MVLGIPPTRSVSKGLPRGVRARWRVCGLAALGQRARRGRAGVSILRLQACNQPSDSIMNLINSTMETSWAADKRLIVLVCTYNEKANLAELFQRIDQAIPNVPILVVDDNSPDGTSDWVAQESKSRPHTYLIKRSGKLGLGTAIRDGMQYAIEHGYEWVLNLDADLSHDPSAMLKLLSKSEDNDLVIGSRYVEGGGLEGCSWKRILVSRCANAYAKFVVGWRVNDCSSAYRLYRVSELTKLNWQQIQGKGYGFLEEILWHLIQQTKRWTEVGIVYTERKKGDSKISIKEALSTIASLHRVASLKRTTVNKPSK